MQLGMKSQLCSKVKTFFKKSFRILKQMIQSQRKNIDENDNFKGYVHQMTLVWLTADISNFFLPLYLCLHFVQIRF